MEICCFASKNRSIHHETSNFRPFCCTRLYLRDKCKILIFNLHKVKFSFFWHFTCMGGWSQISVRFALRGLVSEINGKKKVWSQIFVRFAIRGFVSEKKKKNPQKSKIFIFLTFYMYGLAQIFVRFALWGLVSEKRKKKNFHFFDILHVWVSSNFRPFRSTRLSFREKKKKKIFIFLTFYMYGWSKIFVRFALRGLVSEKNEKNYFYFFSTKKVKFWHFTCTGYLKFASVSLYEA